MLKRPPTLLKLDINGINSGITLKLGGIEEKEMALWLAGG